MREIAHIVTYWQIDCHIDLGTQIFVHVKRDVCRKVYRSLIDHVSFANSNMFFSHHFIHVSGNEKAESGPVMMRAVIYV